jgi:hypothetical protein
MSSNNAEVLHVMTDDLYSDVKTGLVVERHGDKLLVENSATLLLLDCGQRPALQREQLVCGDEVLFQLVKATATPGAAYQREGLVVGRRPRHNLLYRSDPLHRAAKKIKVTWLDVMRRCVIFSVLF